MYRPAHHPKAGEWREFDERNVAALCAWLERRATNFLAVDPLPARARLTANRMLLTKRCSARFWLIANRIRQRHEARAARRSALIVHDGGRR